jgi:hypothetical protein
LKLLNEAGFIEGAELKGRHFLPGRITWQGHEFLNSVRDPKIWSETKKTLREFSDGVSLEVIKSVAVSLTKVAIGIP